MYSNWIDAAHQLSRQGEAYVMATLIGVSGSTPRNSGTKMVITSERIYDTIGGGHMEHKVINHGHKMLAKGEAGQHIEHFQLAAGLGQCCGGTATVLFECFAQSSVNIMLFGAGHVGQALAGILAGLPCKVRWVDNREEQFPSAIYMQSLHNITQVVSDSPADEVMSMPENSYYIVMTHNHQLDFEICQKILQHRSFNYLGLIASTTKWRRFQQRFAHRDIDSQLIERMSCPVGLSEVPGKKPMEIAVSIAAELIGIYQSQSAPKPVEQKGSGQGVPWRDVKQLLVQDEVVHG